MGRLKLSLRWTHVSDLASFFAVHNIQFTYKIACFNWRQLFSLSVTNNIEIAILSNCRGFIIKLLVCIIVILGKHIFIISVLLLLKDYLSRPWKFFDISKQLPRTETETNKYYHDMGIGLFSSLHRAFQHLLGTHLHYPLLNHILRNIGLVIKSKVSRCLTKPPSSIWPNLLSE